MVLFVVAISGVGIIITAKNHEFGRSKIDSFWPMVNGLKSSGLRIHTLNSRGFLEGISSVR